MLIKFVFWIDKSHYEISWEQIMQNVFYYKNNED
jgi:hypothetical protein